METLKYLPSFVRIHPAIKLAPWEAGERHRKSFWPEACGQGSQEGQEGSLDGGWKVKTDGRMEEMEGRGGSD